MLNILLLEKFYAEFGEYTMIKPTLLRINYCHAKNNFCDTLLQENFVKYPVSAFYRFNCARYNEEVYPINFFP